MPRRSERNWSTFDIPLNGLYQPPAGGRPVAQTNVITMGWDAACPGYHRPDAPQVQTGEPPPKDAAVTPAK